MPKLTFTDHAIERLEERKLRRPYVYWAWKHAKEVVYSWNQLVELHIRHGSRMDHTKHFFGLGILFVVDISDSERWVLVTAYAREQRGLKLKNN